LRAFKEEHKSKYILVSQDPNPRKTDDGILILPWKVFLNRLWANKIISWWCRHQTDFTYNNFSWSKREENDWFFPDFPSCNLRRI